MATYTLRRKLFSDDEKGGMSTGAKIAAGVGTLGAGLLAAKHGMLGGAAQRGVGKGMMSLGMKNSGAKTLAQGQYRRATSTITKNKGAEAAEAFGKDKEEWIKNRTNRNIREFDAKQAAKEAAQNTTTPTV